MNTSEKSEADLEWFQESEKFGNCIVIPYETTKITVIIKICMCIFIWKKS